MCVCPQRLSDFLLDALIFAVSVGFVGGDVWAGHVEATANHREETKEKAALEQLFPPTETAAPLFNLTVSKHRHFNQRSHEAGTDIEMFQ